MAFELKPGQGTLHVVTDKQGVETRPDRTGELNIDGTIYKLSGWIKQGKAGPWLSLSAEIPRPKAQQERRDPPQRTPHSEIPF